MLLIFSTKFDLGIDDFYGVSLCKFPSSPQKKPRKSVEAPILKLPCNKTSPAGHL